VAHTTIDLYAAKSALEAGADSRIPGARSLRVVGSNVCKADKTALNRLTGDRQAITQLAHAPSKPALESKPIGPNVTA
jgi:hypothetical protein